MDGLREICRKRNLETEGKKKDEIIKMLIEEGEEQATPPVESKSFQADPMLKMMEMLQKQMLLQEERQLQWQKEQQQLMFSFMEKVKTEDTKPRLPKPTLQKMTEGENVENFLDMFEKVATQQGWPKEVWSTQLAGLLTGKALAAFVNVPKETSDDYEVVKTAILRRYDVNAETYRQRFRTNRRRGAETYRELADRSRDLYVKWKEAAEMNLDEMILVEQFMQAVPEDLRVWLKERKPESQRKAAELADDYVLARKADNRGNTLKPRRFDTEQITSSKPPMFDDRSARSNDSSKSHPMTDGSLTRPDKTNTKGEKQCYYCKKYGHLMYSCPDRKSDGETARPRDTMFSRVCPDVAWNTDSHKYLKKGKVDGRSVRMLVDTGCDRTMVRASAVNEDKHDYNNTSKVLCVHGDQESYPSATVDIEMDGAVKTLTVTLAPELPSGLDVLIGRDILLEDKELKTGEQSLAVVTRAQERKEKERAAKLERSVVSDAEAKSNVKLTKDDNKQINEKPNDHKNVKPEQAIKTDPDGQDKTKETVLEVGPQTLIKWQQEDATLEKARELARDASETVDEDGERVFFYYKKGLLYRSWRPKKRDLGDVRQCEQLVLPSQSRAIVLNLAHGVPTAGHLGITKTKDRVLQRYYWPGVFKDVAHYCRTCDTCQRCQPRGTQVKAEMIPMPIISKPFQRIAMDIVGPIDRSRSGNKYILTICDYATRYPEAIPLPSTEAGRIAKHLVEVFSRVGIPEEILTDQGANFMSALLQDVYQLLSIKRIRTSPYHPQTDGLVERFNSTLKSMLRKFVASNTKDWDEYLPYLLFAYREVPQESTGFSPFELLYGRRVRGPLDVLREMWTGDEPVEEQTVFTHLTEMRKRLEQMSELVQSNMTASQKKQKEHYDKKLKEQPLKVGDKVLVLIPSRKSKLKLERVGPYTVTREVTPVDYEVQMPGRRKEKRVYHVNLLKKWNEAESSQEKMLLARLEREDEDEGQAAMELPRIESNQDNSPQSSMNEELTEQQRHELETLINEYSSLFSESPGRTSMVEHVIDTGTANPITQRPYRVPMAQRKVVKELLEQMMAEGTIRESKSAWASPIVLVDKPDGTVRFCVDYRKLNGVAKFDAYPMPRADEILERVGQAMYISTLDLTKGYWQIPMEESSKEKTAFTTPFGLFQFDVLPFGLHSSPATFQRMMDRILHGCQDYADAYIDDVGIFSLRWEDHLAHLRDVFERLKRAGLTVKLKKCQFGRSEVSLLGHVVGRGQIKPDPKKIQAVQEYPQPRTKTDVRSFLGLAGYYRKFIPNFASLTEPLTNLTRKNAAEKVKWDDDCETAFQDIKSKLVMAPVLKAPDNDLPFVVQTDASDKGIGAVLSQIHPDGQEHPIAYASRKLLPRETRYAVVEKECLGIVWALKYFRHFLYGREFTIQTDHKPLTWLKRMGNSNQRLTRWSLTLQEYRFSIEHRKGSNHGNADGLSRGPI